MKAEVFQVFVNSFGGISSVQSWRWSLLCFLPPVQPPCISQSNEFVSLGFIESYDSLVGRDL